VKLERYIDIVEVTGLPRCISFDNQEKVRRKAKPQQW